MTLHLVGLPHTQPNGKYSTCAFTQLNVNFLRMFPDAVYYGPSGLEVPCAEAVELISPEEQHEFFGEWDKDKVSTASWDPKSKHWEWFNDRANYHLANRVDPSKDLVLLSAGHSFSPLIEDLLIDKTTVVEYAVGYIGVAAPYRIWPSHAWMHWVNGHWKDNNGRYYDDVVPHFVNRKELPVGLGGDYLAWMGRWSSRKGQQAAMAIAEAAGMRLRMAGPDYDGTPLPDHVSHVGSLNIQQRAKFLGGAKAVLMPTDYFEPFGLVAIEAMACGTPVLTTDWGAFPEIVPSFWRFRTLHEAVTAIEELDSFSRYYASQKAGFFGLDVIKPRYEATFDRLLGLRHGGWYSRPIDRFQSKAGDVSHGTQEGKEGEKAVEPRLPSTEEARAVSSVSTSE